MVFYTITLYFPRFCPDFNPPEQSAVACIPRPERARLTFWKADGFVCGVTRPFQTTFASVGVPLCPGTGTGRAQISRNIRRASPPSTDPIPFPSIPSQRRAGRKIRVFPHLSVGNSTGHCGCHNKTISSPASPTCGARRQLYPPESCKSSQSHPGNL